MLTRVQEQAAKVHAQMHPEEARAKVATKAKKDPPPQPEVDDDGWETVKRKPKRR